MTTTAQIATVPQINVIKGISQAIWGSEWIVLDEYGDSEGVVDRDIAAGLITALQEVKKLPVHELDDGAKLDLLAQVLVGKSPTVGRELEANSPGGGEGAEVATRKADQFDSIPPVARPAWQRVDLDLELTKEEPTETPTQRAVKAIEHGTLKGYSAHKKHGEDPCDDCVEGARASWRISTQETKDRAKANRTEKATKKKAATPKARSNGARAVQRPTDTEGESTFVFAGPGMPTKATHILQSDRLLLEGLLAALPDVEEPFSQDHKERWKKLADLIIDVVWPNS